MITHDRPTSRGMENVLARAALLRELRWTPIAKMPMSTRYNAKENAAAPKAYFQTWRPQFGIPYSSVAVAEKFVGFNVSLETYFSALANPRSVLYTRNLTGTRKNTTCWYGSVCSVYVGYALGLPCRRVCRLWGSFGDMDALGEFTTAQDIRLCDILCNDHHVAIVTDVARDADGAVVSVTVSECTPPQVIGVTYTPEELYHSWLKKYQVFRYLNIDQVPPVEDAPPAAINKTLLPDYGNKANYALGESVELNVMEDGWETLCIQFGNKVVFSASIAEPGVISWMPKEAGHYTAYCERNYSRSEAVAFAVTKIHNSAVVCGDAAEVTIHCDDRVVCCMLSLQPDFETVYYHNLTTAESNEKKVTMTGLIPGDYDLKTIAANDYGQYVSPTTVITVA